MTIEVEQHKSSQKALVSLYTLDTTPIGGGTVYYFTPEDTDVHPVWKGNTYVPFPIQITGLKHQMSGSLPRPQLTVSNIDGILLAAVLSLGDLVGAEITLERTFEHFLDNGSNPNPNTALPTERYIVSQKKVQNDLYISWEVVSPLDVQGTKIPRRQVLRDDFPGVGKFRIRS